jgi:hypothetical protein
LAGFPADANHLGLRRQGELCVLIRDCWMRHTKRESVWGQFAGLVEFRFRSQGGETSRGGRVSTFGTFLVVRWGPCRCVGWGGCLSFLARGSGMDNLVADNDAVAADGGLDVLVLGAGRARLVLAAAGAAAVDADAVALAGDAVALAGA